MLENARNYAVTSKVRRATFKNQFVKYSKIETTQERCIDGVPLVRKCLQVFQTDITTFANTACASLPKGRQSDQCYQLADKKIADLAKFVDQQVVEALWCAELNQC